MGTRNLGTGRKKMGNTKILKKSNLQVTFSKRRSGLFKKASDLSTLCGVEVAIIVFSPGNKVFSFGHPGVEFIADRFLAGNLPSSGRKRHQLLEARRNHDIHELNVHLTGILDQLEAEKKYGEALDQMRSGDRRQYWWEAPVAELGLSELEQLRAAMEELKKNIAKQANMSFTESTTNSPTYLESKPSEINATSIIPNVYNF